MHALSYLLFPVLHALGGVLLWVSAAMLIPLGVSYWKTDGAQYDFLLAIAATLLTGLVFLVCFKGDKRELSVKHGFLLVTLSWTLIAVFGAIPLLFQLPEQSFTKLVFETMSCLTTTGATALVGLDDLPVSINGWRCFLSWLGGMGLIVLSVAILPLLGVGGAQVMKAESSGPMKETKLTPRIAQTARGLYAIYFGISVVCVFAYHQAGMNWEDAFMHMMTTVSLSGISTHDASFGFFESDCVKLVAVFFMLLCGCNFSLHFLAWRRRNPFLYFMDFEARSWVGVALTAGLATALMLFLKLDYDNFFEAFVDGLFVVVATASTTGFTSVDYSLWPFGFPFWIMFLAAFASCAGSTGGGIKMIRAVILVKDCVRELRQLQLPQGVYPILVGRDAITPRVAASVAVFVQVWFLAVLTGTVVLTFTGLPVLEAFSGTFAAITNLGPGLGALGPSGNYANLNDLQLGILTFYMLIGRLELFTVFVLFTRSFWKN